MKLFRHENRQQSERSRRIYAITEVAYTAVDFGAAMCFLIGSVMFFWDSLYTAAVWLFVVGSFLFAVKPTIKFGREVKLAAMGDEKSLANRD